MGSSGDRKEGAQLSTAVSEASLCLPGFGGHVLTRPPPGGLSASRATALWISSWKILPAVSQGHKRPLNHPSVFLNSGLHKNHPRFFKNMPPGPRR